MRPGGQGPRRRDREGTDLTRQGSAVAHLPRRTSKSESNLVGLGVGLHQEGGSDTYVVGLERGS